MGPKSKTKIARAALLLAASVSEGAFEKRGVALRLKMDEVDPLQQLLEANLEPSWLDDDMFDGSLGGDSGLGCFEPEPQEQRLIGQQAFDAEPQDAFLETQPHPLATQPQERTLSAQQQPHLLTRQPQPRNFDNGAAFTRQPQPRKFDTGAAWLKAAQKIRRELKAPQIPRDMETQTDLSITGNNELPTEAQTVVRSLRGSATAQQEDQKLVCGVHTVHLPGAQPQAVAAGSTGTAILQRLQSSLERIQQPASLDPAWTPKHDGFLIDAVEIVLVMPPLMPMPAKRHLVQSMVDGARTGMKKIELLTLLQQLLRQGTDTSPMDVSNLVTFFSAGATARASALKDLPTYKKWYGGAQQVYMKWAPMINPIFDALCTHARIPVPDPGCAAHWAREKKLIQKILTANSNREERGWVEPEIPLTPVQLRMKDVLAATERNFKVRRARGDNKKKEVNKKKDVAEEELRQREEKRKREEAFLPLLQQGITQRPPAPVKVEADGGPEAKRQKIASDQVPAVAVKVEAPGSPSQAMDSTHSPTSTAVKNFGLVEAQPVSFTGVNDSAAGAPQSFDGSGIDSDVADAILGMGSDIVEAVVASTETPGF